MRVLFASTQGAGHVGPLIPFIDAAARGGHETLVVGPPTLKARGYEFKPGASPPDELLGPLWGRMPSLPPGQGDLVVVPLFGDQPSNAVRVAVSGAGVASSVDQIAERIRLVLDDGRYRDTARALAEAMRAHPPVDEFFASY